MGGYRLDPKKSRREIFQRIFALGIIRGGMSCYAATPLIVALSPGHTDTTRFRPFDRGGRLASQGYLFSVDKQNINCHRKSFGSRRKNSRFAQTTGTVDVFDPRSGISGPSSRSASACPNLHE